MKFETIDYLREGNPKQQKLYQVLSQSAILEFLAPYDPLVAGTIPINIDVDGSDVDIVCHVADSYGFTEAVRGRFGDEAGFETTSSTSRGKEHTLIRFMLGGFCFELFGQDIPSRKQAAWRHMLIENNIILHRGDYFRQKVVDLKRQGMKTEPAFAHLLNLKGDPYETLLTLSP